MGEVVADIHHHADVGGVLELGGERRAVDHLEAGAQEVVAHEREGVHVGGVVVRIAPRHRVAVAAVHDDAARRVAERGVGGGDEPAGLDAAQPGAGVLGEALGRLLALALQRQIDVVVVNEHRAQARPASFPAHFRRPPFVASSSLELLYESRGSCKRAQDPSADHQHKPKTISGLGAVREARRGWKTRCTRKRLRPDGRTRGEAVAKVCSAADRSRAVPARSRRSGSRAPPCSRRASSRRGLPPAARRRPAPPLAGARRRQGRAPGECRAGPAHSPRSGTAARRHTNATPPTRRPCASATPRRRRAGNRWRSTRRGRDRAEADRCRVAEGLAIAAALGVRLQIEQVGDVVG